MTQGQRKDNGDNDNKRRAKAVWAGCEMRTHKGMTKKWREKETERERMKIKSKRNINKYFNFCTKISFYIWPADKILERAAGAQKKIKSTRSTANTHTYIRTHTHTYAVKHLQGVTKC